MPPLLPVQCLAPVSLSPPNTNLEWVGWRDPNTLRADPGLSVLRPQNASAPVTRAETATGEMYWIQPAWSPLGCGSSWAMY